MILDLAHDFSPFLIVSAGAFDSSAGGRPSSVAVAKHFTETESATVQELAMGKMLKEPLPFAQAAKGTRIPSEKWKGESRNAGA